MIDVITEDWFWKDLKEDEKFESIYIKQKPIQNEYINSFREFYFEIPKKGKFVLIPLIKRVIIPDTYKETLKLDDIDFNDISFNDWEITMISPKLDPKYIRNQYVKHDSFLISANEIILKLGSGSFRISNKRTGENIDFSIMKDDKYSWSQGIYLCYPEKCEDILRIKEINKKEFFITYMINGIRKADKRRDIEG